MVCPTKQAWLLIATVALGCSSASDLKGPAPLPAESEVARLQLQMLMKEEVDLSQPNIKLTTLTEDENERISNDLRLASLRDQLLELDSLVAKAELTKEGTESIRMWRDVAAKQVWDTIASRRIDLEHRVELPLAFFLSDDMINDPASKQLDYVKKNAKRSDFRGVFIQVLEIDVRCQERRADLELARERAAKAIR